MRAVVYEKFQGPMAVRTVADPAPARDGVVIEVKANGICRSDWHGWMGHDTDIDLPHVPGHECAGVVTAVGADVVNWKAGDRVVVPFACGCGVCEPCSHGDTHICDDHFQPGFTAWGAFAEYVAIDHADVNLVGLPESIDFVSAASLGCRFTTAWRAVVDQGRLQAGDWLAVHGVGGVGLSAVMIGRALGARVIAVDINDDHLNLARDLGAEVVLNAKAQADVPGAILDVTKDGAHVSLDALGSAETAYNSVAGLRKRGRHVQVGLTLADEADVAVPMSRVIGRELEILGSHGMPTHAFPALLKMIEAGTLDPAKLVTGTVTLEDSIGVLEGMSDFKASGVVVIDRF